MPTAQCLKVLWTTPLPGFSQNRDAPEGGCPAAELAEVIGLLTACPALPLRGFMALPPPGFPEAFRQMAALREAWQDRLGQPLRLSMGMSDDLEAAIAAGSDQVRVGTAFFGAR